MSEQQISTTAPEDWQYPYQLRVNGFAETDIQDFVRNDLMSIVAPTLNTLPAEALLNRKRPLGNEFGLPPQCLRASVL